MLKKTFQQQLTFRHTFIRICLPFATSFVTLALVLLAAGALAAWIHSQYTHPRRGLSRGTSQTAGALAKGRRSSQPAASISSSGMSKLAATLATSS